MSVTAGREQTWGGSSEGQGSPPVLWGGTLEKEQPPWITDFFHLNHDFFSPLSTCMQRTALVILPVCARVGGNREEGAGSTLHLPWVLQHRTGTWGDPGKCWAHRTPRVQMHSSAPEEHPLQLGTGPDKSLWTLAAPS